MKCAYCNAPCDDRPVRYEAVCWDCWRAHWPAPPALWRIWGASRYRWTRLLRYWLALLACRRHGHIRNLHRSDGTTGCGRCHTRGDTSAVTTGEVDG